MKPEIFPKQPILMIDDEEQFLLGASTALANKGFNNVITCADSRKAMQILSEAEYSVIILDLIMPHVSGLELLKQIHDEYPELIVVVLTAIHEVETAVKCMQMGAFDYIVKPVNNTRLVTTLKRAVQFAEMRTENTRLKKYLVSGELEHPEFFTEIVTQNDKMFSLFQYMEAISFSPLPVLITGETGTGKELFARTIHRLSERAGKLVTVNVAGLDDHLFSDALFGHKRGAFTGATNDRKGLIEKATGGTIFLDEIGDLKPESQVKLLRLIQDNGEYYPIGSDIPRPCNARIIVATNANLASRKKSGEFRKDLYYRLSTYHIHVPALRQRKDDIPLLLEHLFTKAADILNKKRPTPPKELVTLLRNYAFPGNIRELEAMVFDAISRRRSGRLSLDSFREKLKDTFPDDGDFLPEEAVETEAYPSTLMFPEKLPDIKELQDMLIDEALRRTDGNQRQAAELIGLSRRALNNRLHK